MRTENIRKEVMQLLAKKVDEFVEKYLRPVDKIWQPSDLLPNSNDPDFLERLRDLREVSQDMPYDFWVSLVGDTITEEALPTYESWLMHVEGVSQEENTGWSKWIRQWTSEENRHGDVLNKYLYLSGRVNMRQIEVTTQYLISDGFDIGTGNDPYKNFVYTSFQELATHVSHKRVAEIAQKYDNHDLAKMCHWIAGDEMRHHKAYSVFVSNIFELDTSEMMLAYAHMMKHKITMPAVFLRELGQQAGAAFQQFSNSAQRIGVYTSADYVEILRTLNKIWKIDAIGNLNAEAEKARDFLMKLPDRMEKIAERLVIPPDVFKFSWVDPVMIKTIF
ncbi:acyl-ACP desaturase [Bacteroidales bacterium]|nr:acyl-ACP desaturase [Bacteroidales bacterium]